MKAVVLIGGASKWLYPLSQHRPRGMLPIGNVPALRHNILNLSAWGVTEICIPLDAANQSVRDYFPEGVYEGVLLRYAYTRKFLGTAGCLRLFSDALRDEPFLIINGNSFSRPILEPLCDSPFTKEPFLRIGVYESTERKSANVYYAHPAVLESIPKDSYFDLKEQLVPLLRTVGCRVESVPLTGVINELRSFEEYLEANQHIARLCAPKHGLTALNIRISDDAYLEGPVIIGENTIIGANSVIVGPTVIGPNCRIGKGVLIHQSVIDEGVRIRSYCHIQKSILIKGADVKRHSRLLKTIGINGTGFPKVHQQLFEVTPSLGWVISDTNRNTVPSVRKQSSLPIAGYPLKRFLDVTLTLMAAPILIPVVLVLAAIVKLTSRGPVLYNETRVGRNGKEFTLYKLRTMAQGAHLQLTALQPKKQGDGPMFKLENDPRVTPIGRWLRKTSLDELPQFWNVLKGDMSLVGPRPLAARELKWNRHWKEMRLLARPGITGLWQVMTGVYSDFSDWIIYDLQYVRTLTLWLDIKILFLTVARVVKGRS